ncbi:MAG TPA: biotin carboxylase N-terminal domain-containing protein [Candidatus Limnocylindrales bacterium]|nr:biotin carboxylase N-terminal domain-containing protein [Candidatus Limnocylindrales bacterium]
MSSGRRKPGLESFGRSRCWRRSATRTRERSMATSRSEAPPAPQSGTPSLRKDTSAPPFRRLLIANRGEIAVRIIRACRELGIETVAVYSDADAHAAHVRLAGAAVRIGPPPPTESYLRIDAIVAAAVETGSEAVHPGYGFLAERASFATAVEHAGLAFVGPPASVIDALGDKLHARRTARAVGVDAVPGTLEPAPVDQPDQVEAILAEAEAIGFPLLVKAAAGGGGRGMRRVATAADLPAALAAGSQEAASAFGDGSVYLEREIAPARHIEVQLLGDADGRVIAIGERDCSLQRRHQKLVEEAPAPGLTREERTHLHDLAVRVATAAGLRNAATAEFLRAPDGRFYFLEVNTRLQVEHGVTELVSGLDIVREQLFLAAGRPLSEAALAAAQAAAAPASHAIEVRISAEDPGRAFAPTPGRVTHWVMPAGPGVRVDTAIQAGERVPPDYDNLIAKLMVHAGDRPAAIDRLGRALDETEIAGIQTSLPFHRFVARDPSFREEELSTDWVAKHWEGAAEQAAAAGVAQLVAGLHALDVRDQAGALGRGVATGNGSWRRAGLEEAADRWPR